MGVEVSVIRRLEDLERAFHLLTTGTAARVIRVATLTLSGVVLALAAAWHEPLLAFQATFLVATVILPPAISRRRLRRNWTDTAADPDIVCRLDADGLSTRHTSGERRYRWDDVQDLAVDERLLVLRLQPFRMLVIPRSSAPEELPTLAKQWWTDARDRPTPRSWRVGHTPQLVYLALVIASIPLFSPASGTTPGEPATQVIILPGWGTLTPAPPPACTRVDTDRIAVWFGTADVHGPTWDPTGTDLSCTWGLNGVGGPDGGVVSVTIATGGSAATTASFRSAQAAPPDTAGGVLHVVRTPLRVPGSTAFEDVSGVDHVVHLLRGGDYATVRLVMDAAARPGTGSAPLVALALAALEAAAKP